MQSTPGEEPEHHQHHGHGHAHHDHHHDSSKTPNENIFLLAVSATLHCLLGCGIGEVAGMVVATVFNLGMVGSMILALLLGFVAGFTLGMRPLVKAGWAVEKAFKVVLVAEGLSIAVMEGFEIWTQVMIPGVMEAGLTDGIFWIGMIAGLAAGFIAALPINYIMIKNGVRHHH